jgi:DNA-binding LacI/PurR family transcriptional regulator
MSSIKEVAQIAGVSVTTVSYVLNNKGHIRPETRQHVLKVIEQLGYRRSSQARNLRDGQSRIIGYAWRAPETEAELEGNPILDSFLNSVIKGLEAHGLHLLVFNDPTESEVDLYDDLIKSRRLDGFILAKTQQDDHRVAFLQAVGFPFVAFGRTNTPLDADTAWVDVDGEAGIFAATQHLIEQGHQQIGLIAWPDFSVTGEHRIMGYQRALAQAGIAYDPRLTVRQENFVSEGYRGAAQLLCAPHPPSAIVTVCDTLALGALRYINEQGLQVAITGYDDIPVAKFLNPPLTTLRQPIRAVAERLVEMLLIQLQGEALPQKHHLLSPELIIRASSVL